MTNIEQCFCFPANTPVLQTRKRVFNYRLFSINQLNRNVFPYECVKGWFVTETHMVNEDQIEVTFGKAW